jgi:hypothetical protein
VYKKEEMERKLKKKKKKQIQHPNPKPKTLPIQLPRASDKQTNQIQLFICYLQVVPKTSKHVDSQGNSLGIRPSKLD